MKRTHLLFRNFCKLFMVFILFEVTYHRVCQKVILLLIRNVLVVLTRFFALADKRYY